MTEYSFTPEQIEQTASAYEFGEWGGERTGAMLRVGAALLRLAGVVYVITGYDPTTLQTENVGGSTSIDDAKTLAVEHLDMLDNTTPGHPVRIYVEEWHRGEFHAQRELRTGTEWWIAEAPLFLPIKES